METVFEKVTSPRKRVFFGFDWMFALTDEREKPDAGAQWRRVQLPHDWSCDYPVDEHAPSCGSGGYARCGIGWYKKAFCLAEKGKDEILLQFDGVYMHSDVWVNGTWAGGHAYGYTGFELDITALVREGENEVVVRVDNSHQPGSRWYTGSGITRNVFLTRRQKLHVRTWGVQVTTPVISGEEAVVEVRTDVRGGEAAGHLCVETVLLSPDGEAARGSVLLPSLPAHTAVQVLKVKSPLIWDLETPCLYQAVTRVYDGETLTDEVVTPFGIRTLAFDNQNGFSLNGRKVILRGVCLHHDGGCVGAAVPKEVWKRRLEKLKAMGCNALRMSHNPSDPALLDLADEMGF